jgi:hypothetical protein
MLYSLYTESIVKLTTKMRQREEKRTEPAEMKFLYSVKRCITEDRMPAHETIQELQIDSVFWLAIEVEAALR